MLRSALLHCAVPITHIRLSRIYFLQFMAIIFIEAVVSYEAVKTHLCFNRHCSVVLCRPSVLKFMARIISEMVSSYETSTRGACVSVGIAAPYSADKNSSSCLLRTSNARLDNSVQLWRYTTFLRLLYIYIYNGKQSRNRPGVAQKVPGGLGSQIFMIFGTYRWWGRHPHAPAAFTPTNVPGTHFH